MTAKKSKKPNTLMAAIVSAKQYKAKTKKRAKKVVKAWGGYVLTPDEMTRVEHTLCHSISQDECDLFEHIFRRANVKWYEPAKSPPQGAEE